MPWSTYQTSIFTHVSDPRNGSAMIEAVAGSGKTTTLVEALEHIPFSEPDALFLAFNKAIADELRSRVPSDVEAKTFNSLGNSILTRHLGTKMNPRKMQDFIKSNASDEVKEEAWGALSTLIRQAKSAGWGVLEDCPTLDLLTDHHDIAVPAHLEREVFQLANRALDWSLRSSEHDFDDQLLLPLIHDLRFPKYDIVFVDEAQDLSPLQHEFLSRLLKPKGRVIAVGDTHQAIYGFRGADANSMQALRDRFNTTELPLSITYRCPVSVTAAAAEYNPSIQPHSDAPDGAVSNLDSLPELEELTPNDYVLCRVNAPLMSLGLRFLRQNLPVHVLGNFGDNLIRFIKSFKTNDLSDFEAKLRAWHDREVEAAESRNRWGKAAGIRDKYASILAVAEGAQDVPHLLKRLEKLFEPKRAPKLGTIHKSKGGEAERVFLIHPEKIPFFLATQDWQLQQEDNLMYVALTRAWDSFYYVHEEDD